MKDPFLYTITISALLLFVGCNPAQLKSSVDDFDQATEGAVKSLRSFYSSLNDTTRQIYCAQLKIDPSRKMFIRESQSKALGNMSTAGELPKARTTGLITRFSNDEIRVRLDVLEILVKYTSGLAALAYSRAPTEAGDAMKSLGTQIGQLGDDITKVTSSGSDVNLKNYSGPLSNILQVVSTEWLEHRRDSDIRNSVVSSAQTVDKLFDTLESDVENLRTGLYIAEKGLLSDYIEFYNDHYVKDGDSSLVTNSDRAQFLETIQALATKIDVMEAMDPAPMIKHMRAIHDDLLLLSLPQKRDRANHGSIREDVKALLIDVQRINANATSR